MQKSARLKLLRECLAVTLKRSLNLRSLKRRIVQVKSRVKNQQQSLPLKKQVVEKRKAIIPMERENRKYQHYRI